MKISGVVLAGGKGHRLGGEKAWIELGGKPLLKWTADRLARAFLDVIVVADAVERFQGLPYQCVADRQLGLGPIGGIDTALRTTSAEAIFAVACDMPFLQHEVIRWMVDLAEGYDLVIPDLSDGLHPLHALYTRRCLSAIEAQIRKRDLALHALPRMVKTHFVSEETLRRLDPSLLSVMNINTPEDLKRARRILKEEAQ